MAIIEEKVAKVSDLKDGEMKEVKVGSKKALLSKIEGKYYATGFLCTHYKAPLSKGTLSPEGRVVCPWHGAAFNLKDGNVKDAPGLDALTSYEIKIEGDDVIVVADEAALEEGRRVPTTVSPSADDSRTIIIVGGGAAGFGAASTLREQGFTGKVIIISRESYLPIDRVKLSKSLKVEVEKVLLRNQAYYDAAGIQTKLGQEVSDVDPNTKTVTLSNGESLTYDQLLLAPGADPRFFWGDAKRFSNVFLVRGITDAQGIDTVLENKKDANIVIVGSSFIGMEAAAVLAKSGKSLTVIGMEKVPFERVLGEKVGGALQKLHEEKGVKFRMGVVVESFDEENGECVSITLKGGEKIPADLVVVGAGVLPATTFLKKNFKLEPDQSVLVNQFLEVEQFPGVFVAGDVARFPYHLNHGKEGTVRIEHWNVAQQQGRVAALNILGKKVPFELVPFFWTTQYGKSVRYVGHALGYDDIIIEGSLEELSFIAYYVKGEEILAVCSLGKDPACSNAAELMRLKRLPSVSQIKAGGSVLGTPFVSPSSPSPSPAEKTSQNLPESSKPRKIIPPKDPSSSFSSSKKSSSESSSFSKAFPFLVVALAIALGYLFFGREK